MHRIDTPTAQKDKFGAGKNGFTAGNPQTGTPATDLDNDYFDMLQEELAGVVEATGVDLDKSKHNQLLTALKALLLSRAHPFADIKADGAAAIAEALSNLQLRESFSGVVGQSRNARMSVAAASATATFSADELIVEDSGGRQYRVTSFSKVINLATTGAGGMDTGVVPATGFVALYAIYNPTTSTSALLAVNATNANVPEVYGGTNMPIGYTASALVSVWGVTGGAFIVGFQRERTIAIERVVAAYSTVPVNTLTSLSIANIIPMNAVAISGILAVAGINTTNAVTELAASANYLAAVQAGGNSTIGGAQNVSVSPYSDMSITTSQSTYWRSSVESGTFTYGTVYINGYKF